MSSILRTIYMDPAWGIIQETKDGGIAETFCFDGSEGKIIYPFIRRKAGVINGTQYYDTVTPRGKCGPIVVEKKDDRLYEEFNRAFQNYSDETNIVAEYINFDPWNTDYDGFRNIYNLVYHGSEFCFNLDGDFFMNEFSSTRRRYTRKAVKSGIDVETDASWERIDDFLKVYSFTVEKYNASQFYIMDRKFLDGYKKKLGDKVKLAFAWYEGKIIASAIFLDGGDVFHYHLAASDPDYLSLNAISLILYREAEKAKETGCRIMDLGSAVIGCSLELFKSTFCRRENILSTYAGTKIRNHKIYDIFIKTNGRGKEGYFPAYARK